MIKLIIVTFITIPVRALFLWAFTGMEFELERALKALFTTLFIITVFLVFKLIPMEGYIGSIIKLFVISDMFKIPFSFLVLWKVYRYKWVSMVFIIILWTAVQIPIDILQSKIYGLLF